MTLPNTLAAARRRLDRLVAAAEPGLPLSTSDTLDGAGDPLRPRFSIQEAGGATTVTLMRDAHVSEGTGRPSVDLDMYLLDGAEADRRIMDEIEAVARLLRQDQAIVAGGGRPEAPGPEWFTAHPFMVEAARHWGWSLHDLVRPAEVVDPRRGSVVVRNDMHVLTNLLQANLGLADVHCARNTLRRHLQCGHLSVMRDNGKTILAQFCDQDHPAVRIPGQRLPETVLVAIAGMRVRDVVDDARLGPMLDLEVVAARNGERALVLEVAEGRIGLGEGKSE